MTLETYRKAMALSDLGSLTEPCPTCQRQTRLRDFVWNGHKVICRECDGSKPRLKGNEVYFDVRIPNADGTGIAETIEIAVPIRIDPQTGDEILTPEALQMIEQTKAKMKAALAGQEEGTGSR